jgi:hypothetical protein
MALLQLEWAGKFEKRFQNLKSSQKPQSDNSIFMRPPIAQRYILWTGSDCKSELGFNHTVDAQCNHVPHCSISCPHYTEPRADKTPPLPSSWADFVQEPQTGCIDDCDAVFVVDSDGSLGCYSKFGLGAMLATDVFHLRRHASLPTNQSGVLKSFDCSRCVEGNKCQYDTCKAGLCKP